MADLQSIMDSAQQVLNDPKFQYLQEQNETTPGYTPVGVTSTVPQEVTQPVGQPLEQAPQLPTEQAPQAPISIEDTLAANGITMAPSRSASNEVADSVGDLNSQLQSAGITINEPGARRPAQTSKDVPSDTNIVEQFGSGTNEGIASILGLPVDLTTMALNTGIGGANYILGTEIPTIQNPVGGSQSIEDSILSPFISEVDPQTTGQRYARRAGRAVGSSVLPAGVAARTGNLTGGTLAGILSTETGAEVGGQLAQDYLGDNIYAELLGTVLGGLAPTSALRTSQSLGNVIKRIADVGDARDVAAVQRVVQSIARQAPERVTEKAIVDAISNDQNLARYLSDTVDSTQDIAATINRGARQSPNTLRALQEDIARPAMLDTQDALQTARTQQGRRLNEELAKITSDEVAPVARSLASGRAGDEFRDLYIRKVEGYLQADNALVKSTAGYPPGVAPKVVFDDKTGIPYVVKWDSKSKAAFVPRKSAKGPLGYRQSDLIPASDFPSVDRNAAQALRDVRADLETVVTPGMREGSQRSQNLTSETTGGLQRDIRESLSTLSPDYARENAQFRAITNTQETVGRSVGGDSPVAIRELRQKFESLSPNDPLKQLLDIDSVERTARENDILSMVGQAYNPRNPGSGVEELESMAKNAIVTTATGNKFAAANTGRDLFRFMRRHGVAGAPNVKEIKDAQVLKHMLTLDSSDLDRIFKELKSKMDAKEYQDLMRNLTLSFNIGSDVLRENEDQNILNELGAR